jgi:hypothetical protein
VPIKSGATSSTLLLKKARVRRLGIGASELAKHGESGISLKAQAIVNL